MCRKTRDIKLVKKILDQYQGTSLKWKYDLGTEQVIWKIVKEHH